VRALLIRLLIWEDDAEILFDALSLLSRYYAFTKFTIQLNDPEYGECVLFSLIKDARSCDN